MADEQVVQEVTAAVNHAIRQNRTIEIVLIVLLVAVSGAGLVLLFTGIQLKQWTLALPGSLCELAIGWPIRSLVKIRQENIRLLILPQLIRMAGGGDEKKLVFKLIETLIQQMAAK